jgi:hypothetical protein
VVGGARATRSTSGALRERITGAMLIGLAAWLAFRER